MNKKSFSILLTAIILGIFFAVVFVMYSNSNALKALRMTRVTVGQDKTKLPDDTILAKAGRETIYFADLAAELSYAPVDNEQQRQHLLQKIIDDSIILQGGAEDKLISLDSSIYNAVKKNYIKRIAAVAQVKTSVKNKSTFIRGTVLSIWFLNNNFVGPLGYEGSKTQAYQKLNEIYELVRSGNISIEEGGKRIQNDTSLITLDKAYPGNAVLRFDVGLDESITFDPSFDAEIKKLRKGEISPILPFREKDPSPDFTGQTLDVAYAFAQVTERNQSDIASYETWLAEKKKLFTVQTFLYEK